ncbi:hypothetical protein ACEPAF_9444 [Sanghuangporus sanghuang]
MERLRRRVPFKPDGEVDVSEDSRILDEQEQEQWISELREKAENLDRRIYRQSQVYTGLSCVLHVILFFRLSLLDETPILFARLFVFIQVLVHVNLLILLTPTLDTPVHRLAKELPRLPLPIPLTLGVASLAPLVSFLSGRSWTQTGWWSVAAVITLLVWIMLQSVQDSRTNLEHLEKLKYDAKGA